jgi:hypothetical protein
MNKYAVVASFFVLTALFRIDADDAPRRKTYFRTRIEEAAFMANLSRFFYNFHIEGTVVDPDGNLITDVKVTQQKYKDSMNSAFYTAKNIIKDGKFEYSSSGCYNWSLLFEKKGYYEEYTGFVSGPNLIKQLESGDVTLKGRTFTKKVSVVLEPWGDLNRKIVYVRNTKLIYSEEGDVKKLRTMFAPYTTAAVPFPDWEDMEFSYEKEKIYTLPKNLIYIIPGRNKDGSHDGTIHLKTTDPKGGFFPLEYKENEHFFRRMWEAPETGYQPEIIVKDGLKNYLQLNYVMQKSGNWQTAPMLLLPKRVPFIPFYFRVNGYYGKGIIKPMTDGESTLEKDKASLDIHFFITRKPGTRNTNTPNVGNNL